MTNSKATIKDVAKEANVSIATVSLVLHNHERISPETSRRVNKAVKKLNYHPSRSARGLVSQKTGNIGFIITEDHFLRSEPFYTRIFIGAEIEAHKYEYYILLTTVPSDYKHGQKLPRFILEKNIDAVIFAGKVPYQLIKRIEKFNKPIAFVDFYPPGKEFPTVLIDNIEGGVMATDYLIKKNHKLIAFIGGDMNHPSISDRFQGYKLAMEKAQLGYNEKNYVITEEYPARENGYNAARQLLKKNKEITAIFACNDAMAIGVIQYLKDSNINIPEDISVIGFDDVEADLLLNPSLTTIAVPKVELGMEAVRLVSDLLKDKNHPHKKIMVPVELIERKSTAELN